MFIRIFEKHTHLTYREFIFYVNEKYFNAMKECLYCYGQKLLIYIFSRAAFILIISFAFYLLFWVTYWNCSYIKKKRSLFRYFYILRIVHLYIINFLIQNFLCKHVLNCHRCVKFLFIDDRITNRRITSKVLMLIH